MSTADVAALKAAGVATVIAARLEASDVAEDEAAEATSPRPWQEKNPRRGAIHRPRQPACRGRGGIVEIDATRIAAINAIGEAITVATLAPFESVTARQMLATIKIIPFAAPRAELDRALEIARDGTSAMTLHAFKPHRLGLVATQLPDTKTSVMDKSRGILDARLAAMGSMIAREIRCEHNELAVAGAVRELLAEDCSPVLIFGASATVDRRDVVPAGIAQAGGEVLHFGMPVDPGNLMLLARHDKTPVIGLPGCARSPKLNGFDWVLARLLAAVDVTPSRCRRHGRRRPAEGDPVAPATARRHPRDAAKPPCCRDNSGRRPVAPHGRTEQADHGRRRQAHGPPRRRSGAGLVGGPGDRRHRRPRGRGRTDARRARCHETVKQLSQRGLSTSLRVGINGLPDDIDAALICLGDMPDIRSHHLDRLIAAFDLEEGRTICVPTAAGKRGNPVLWGREWFAAMTETKGDTGAKHLIGEHADAVCEVAMQDDAALKDVDTMEEMERRRGK